MKTNFLKINFNSLRFKLISTFVVLIIIPVFCIAYISVTTATTNLIDKSKESLYNVTTQTISYYEIALKEIEKVYTDQIIFNKAVGSYMEKAKYTNSVEQLTEITSARNVLGQVGTAYSNTITNAILVKSNNESVGYPTGFDKNVKIADTNWYKKAVASEKGIWMEEHNEGLPDTYNNGYVMSFGRPVKGTSGTEPLGLLILDIKSDFFKNILASVHTGKGVKSYAVLNNHLVIGNGDEMQTKDDLNFDKNILLQKAVENSKSKENMIFNQKYKDENYIVSFSKSKDTGWVFVTTLPESEITAVTRGIQVKTTVLGIVFILIAVIIGIIVSMSIVQGIKKLMEAMERAEKGDLSVSIQLKRKDEIGFLVQSFNSMVGQIQSLIFKSKELAVELNASTGCIANITSESNRISSEIAHSIEEVANGSADQARETEKSIGEISTLAQKIDKIVKSVEVAQNISESVQETTENGIKTADILNQNNSETNKITSNVVTRIRQLNHYVNGIDDITNLLKGISEQTKLLSFNASIESARVGEAGKGFAVVADEIRKLAEQSSASTKEIEDFVKQISAEIKNTTEAVSEADEATKIQSETVRNTALMFRKISQETKSLVKNIIDISNEVSAMDENKNTVMSSIESMSAVSQQTAATAQEVSAYTEEQSAEIHRLDSMVHQLDELAQNLLTQINRFKFL